MTDPSIENLSRREGQIMDVLFRLGSATAAEIRESIPDPPSYSAIRGLLRVLEEKRHVRHEQDGPRYVFKPTIEPKKARSGALERLLKVFFDGSTEKAVAALLDLNAGELSVNDYDRLARLIEQARQQGAR